MECGQEIVFADELGSWMIPGDEKKFIAAFLKSLAAVATPEEFTAVAIPLIRRDSYLSFADQVHRSATRVATTALPAALVTVVTFPPKVDLPYVVTMRLPEDRTPVGRSRVFIDRFTGRVLLTESTRSGGAGARLTAVIRSIHTGDVFGKPSEALWLVVALILASQAVTGFLMWFNGRAARAATARSANLRAGATVGGRPD